MQPQQYQAPYQPQQSPMQPMQPAPKQKKKPTASGILLIAMVVTGVVLVVSLLSWLILSFQTSSDTGDTLAGAAAVIEPESIAPVSASVESTLGVKVPFNARELSAFGFAEEVTYSGGDVTQARPYSVIRLRPLETSQASRSEITMVSPELRITTSIITDYWDQLGDKAEYKDLSKIDMLVQETESQRTEDRWTEAGDVEIKTHGDTEYRRIIFTTKNEAHGITSLREEHCYMTVQNDRPFVACVNNIRSGNFAVLAQLEQVLAQLSFSAPEESDLVDDPEALEKANLAMLNYEGDEEVDASEETTSTSNGESEAEESSEEATVQRAQISPYLSKSADFYSYARAAPSVVRVGVIYCADVRLTLPSGGEGPLLTGACVDKAGTGFFVSRDGYVATSASSVRVKPEEAIRSYIINAPGSSQMYDRLQRVLDYMVEGRIIMQTDADAIVAGVQERNQDVVEKVNALGERIAASNISIAQESYSYAVQLQENPIVVNERGNGSLEFAYSDSVLEAKLEGNNYSIDRTQEQIFNGDTVADDIALLKLEDGKTYPALSIAADMNIPQGESVQIIGKPMYAVGTLGSGQIRSLPLLRQGEAGEVFAGNNAQRILSVGTASHAGLAGAPALNKQGQVIGLATYNNLNCPGGACFASTVVRDPSEISNVARSRNVSLQPGSLTADTWNRGLVELLKGNYTKAAEHFNESARLYPQNYLATPMANYAKSQIGSANDTSTFNTLVVVSQIIALIAVLLLVLLVIARLAMKMFVRPHYATQYGATAGGQYIDPNQWRPTPTPAPRAEPPRPSAQPQPQSQAQPYTSYQAPSVPQSEQVPYVPQPSVQNNTPQAQSSPGQNPPDQPNNWQQ